MTLGLAFKMALATFMVRPWRREPGQLTVFAGGVVCANAVGEAKARASSKLRIRNGARGGVLPSQAERMGAFWEAVFMVEGVCGFGVFVVVVMVFVWMGGGAFAFLDLRG